MKTEKITCDECGKEIDAKSKARIAFTAGRSDFDPKAFVVRAGSRTRIIKDAIDFCDANCLTEWLKRVKDEPQPGEIVYTEEAEGR